MHLPRILYGTAWKKSDTARLVATALRLGFRGIDTACQPKHYDEGGVGAGIAAASASNVARSDIYLQTKFTPVSGHDPARIPYDPKAPLAEQVRQSFAVSLQNLRTDHLDGLVLHSPLSTDGQTLEAWRAMEALVDSGGVRRIGISNCYSRSTLETLYESARIKPAVLQNRFYSETRYDRAIRAYCRERNIVCQSFWTLTANPDLLRNAVILRLSEMHGRTPAQVLFRYLTHVDVTPLTGTRSEEHMRDDLAIFEFTLSAAECASIERLL